MPAPPGAGVTVGWGEHLGPGMDPGADLGFPQTRATVALAPYDLHACMQYRGS
jgi:vanillate/3-O-methylgallate O-demethylase